MSIANGQSRPVGDGDPQASVLPDQPPTPPTPPPPELLEPLESEPETSIKLDMYVPPSLSLSLSLSTSLSPHATVALAARARTPSELRVLYEASAFYNPPSTADMLSHCQSKSQRESSHANANANANDHDHDYVYATSMLTQSKMLYHRASLIEARNTTNTAG